MNLHGSEIVRRLGLTSSLVQATRRSKSSASTAGGIARDFNNAALRHHRQLRPAVALSPTSSASRYADNALAAATDGRTLAKPNCLVFTLRERRRSRLKALVVTDVIRGMQELLTRTLQQGHPHGAGARCSAPLR